MDIILIILIALSFNGRIITAQHEFGSYISMEECAIAMENPSKRQTDKFKSLVAQYETMGYPVILERTSMSCKAKETTKV